MNKIVAYLVLNQLLNDEINFLTIYTRDFNNKQATPFRLSGKIERGDVEEFYFYLFIFLHANNPKSLSGHNLTVFSSLLPSHPPRKIYTYLK